MDKVKIFQPFWWSHSIWVYVNWIEWMNEYCHSFVWLCHSLRVNGVYFISFSRCWFEHNGDIMGKAAVEAALNNTHKAVLFISEQWSIKCSIEMLMWTCLKCTQICVHWLHLCKLEWHFESYGWKCLNEMPLSWCTGVGLLFSVRHITSNTHCHSWFIFCVRLNVRRTRAHIMPDATMCKRKISTWSI